MLFALRPYGYLPKDFGLGGGLDAGLFHYPKIIGNFVLQPCHGGRQTGHPTSAPLPAAPPEVDHLHGRDFSLTMHLQECIRA